MVVSLSNVESANQGGIQTNASEEREIPSRDLAEEVRFCCGEHEEAYNRLTHRQQQYIAVYIRTGSPSAVKQQLGIKGSAHGVSKRLTEIAKIMGCKGSKDLRPDGVACATADQLMAKLTEQRHRCALSGVKLTPETAQLDHIQPLSEGGTNDLSNLQWLVNRVNKAKGTMSQVEFVAMCCEVADYARRDARRPLGSPPSN